MGIALNNGRFAVAVQKSILLYRAQTANSPEYQSATKHFQQATEFRTGKVDCHDLAFGKRGLYFVNTRFNCVARAVEERNFLCCWRPPFIPDLIGEDQCHLNGLGMQNGSPAMVTAFSETNSKKGWRTENRFETGVLVDIAQNRVVSRGLCMPHSPRLHRGKWWLCNSGLGSLCLFDPARESVDEVCQFPGFTRGLCLVKDYGLVGLSRIRKEHVLDTTLFRDKPIKARAGIGLVELSTGRKVGMLEFVSGGNEVFEVLFLPGVKKLSLAQD